MKKRKISDLLKEIFCFEFFLVLSFMIVTFVMMMKHELWFDEVQAWSLAKHLNFIDLIKQMKIEGHSAMWSLFLKIFIELGFSFVILNFISWFIGVLSSIVICYKTNFSKFVKVLIIFNITLLSYSTVFARPYCVAYFMMTLLMIFYRERYNKTLLVSCILLILSNTHLVVMGFLLALFLIEFYNFFKEKEYRKEKVILMCSMVLGVLLFFFQIVGALGSRDAMFSTINIAEMFVNFMDAFTHLFKALFNFKILIFLGVVCLLLIYINLVKYKKYIFILTCTLIFYFVLSFVYPLNTYKSFIIITTIIFCFNDMLYDFDDEKVFKYITLLLVLSIPNSIFTIVDEYNNQISNSHVVWKKIENKKDVKILSLSTFASLSIYCDECEFYNYLGEEKYTYGKFDSYGLVRFDSNKFKRLILEYDADYFVLLATQAQILKDDFEELEDLLISIDVGNINNCASSNTTVCELFELYKINKGAIEYER